MSKKGRKIKQEKGKLIIKCKSFKSKLKHDRIDGNEKSPVVKASEYKPY